LGGVGVGFLTTLGVGVGFFCPTPDQNRRQKIVNWGALRLCGGLDVCAVGRDTKI